MREILSLLPLFLLTFSCISVADPADDGGQGDDQQSTCGAAEGVVSLRTSDGLRLAADWQPPPAAGGATVILLHMIPPSNDRGGYPPRVRQRFAALGLGVLNVDRRGAGGSEGTPTDAYEGEGGRLDVEAAVRFVLDPARACATDPAHIALVGASNGTTSVWDYAVAHDPKLPDPQRLIFLSPGGYTANQNPIDVSRQLPVLWLYPSNEPYSAGFVASAPSSWDFVERGERHGTRMFDSAELEAATLTDMERWLGAAR